MKQIEEVYKGLGRYNCGDIEFILCHSPGDKEREDLPKRYISGEMSRGETPIQKFRVPVIRTGEMPNIDGLYKLEQAICRYENDKVVIERIASVSVDDGGALFNVEERRVMVEEKRVKISCEVHGTPDVFVGHNSNTKYISSWLWEYPLQQDCLSVDYLSLTKEF